MTELTKEMQLRPGVPRERVLAVQEALGVRFPADYVEFMTNANGGEGDVRDAAWVRIWPVEELVEFNDRYSAEELYPGFVLFGTDGGGEAYAFDTRTEPASIVMMPFIGGPEDAVVQGRNLLEFLTNVPQFHEETGGSGFAT